MAQPRGEMLLLIAVCCLIVLPDPQHHNRLTAGSLRRLLEAARLLVTLPPGARSGHPFHGDETLCQITARGRASLSREKLQHIAGVELQI